MSWIRDASWLTEERVRAYVRILFLMQLAAALGWLLLSCPVDLLGKPVGTDFISFWTASGLALGGHPAAAYDLAEHFAAQRALFPSARADYYAFFYPPTYLLLCLPLALLPYGLSLVAWLAATGLAWWRTVRAAAGPANWEPAVLAFPAVAVNAWHGQNGFLTAALLGGAVLLLDRRPVLSGTLLGALAFKPHLAALVPVLLLASGRWRTAGAAAGSAAAFATASLCVLGTEAWQGFLSVAPVAGRVLREGGIGPEKMVSTFAALQLLGSAPEVAWVAQGATALVGALSLAWAARRLRGDPGGGMAAGCLMLTGATLATPFLLDYDLLLLAVPLAWMVRQGLDRGFLPYERASLAAAYVLPLLARTVAGSLGLPVAPLVLLGLHLAVLRRVRSGFERAPVLAGWAVPMLRRPAPP